MEFLDEQSIVVPNVCASCSIAGTSKCGRCRVRFYCCKEHQASDWPVHQRACKPPSAEANPEKTATVLRRNSPSTPAMPTALNLGALLNTRDAQAPSSSTTAVDKDTSTGVSEQILPSEYINKLNPYRVSLNDWCSRITQDMNAYGVCVIDQFMGETSANMILQEVEDLYKTGIFKNGELVCKNPPEPKENVRSDVTTWVDGTEPKCDAIGKLMKELDIILVTCNQMSNNGLFSNYDLRKRTRAMIACYPGDGTFYRRHIDNPFKDGRCVTCVYYLNQDWDVETHGGTLNMYPTAFAPKVLSIEPIFDRIVFFWSDRRNPHAVLPSYANRFAITLWYLDLDERRRYEEGELKKQEASKAND